jgi:hypothetical protein
VKLLVLAGSLLALAVSTAAFAAESAVMDSGTFRISRDQHSLGTERFAYLALGDSLVISSWTIELVPRPDGSDTLEKRMNMVVKGEDFDLRSYESHQTFLGQKLHRALVMEDTSFTSFTQINEAGTGDALVRPPGRIFVIDPQVFSLYDVICRDLNGRTFDKRSLLFYSLGAPDTTIEAIATDVGKETIRWGSGSVEARKIHIDDGQDEFFVWISRKGQMLRLSQPAYGMLIERVRTPVKGGARRPRPGG